MQTKLIILIILSLGLQSCAFKDKTEQSPVQEPSAEQQPTQLQDPTPIQAPDNGKRDVFADSDFTMNIIYIEIQKRRFHSNN